MLALCACCRSQRLCGFCSRLAFLANLACLNGLHVGAAPCGDVPSIWASTCEHVDALEANCGSSTCLVAGCSRFVGMSADLQPNPLPSPACRLKQQGKSAWAGDRNSRCVPPAPSIGQPRVFASALICRGAGVCMPAHLMHQVSNSCTRSDQCTHHTTEVLSKGQGRTQGS